MPIQVKPADYLKTIIIDYFIENYENIILGDEVMYSSERKVVDLLLLYAGETYAVEIKSDKDDLRRLEGQLLEYGKIFDHTILVVTKYHIQKIKNLIPDNVSWFLIDEGKVVDKRISKSKNKIKKTDMLASINSSFLRKRFHFPICLNSDEIRKKIMTQKKEEIHNCMFDYFNDKLKCSYELFLKSRGRTTSVDDLFILSNRTDIV